MKYQGIVRDDLRTLSPRKTRLYDTYKAAHDAAEKLCARTIGDRGSIDVVTVVESYTLHDREADTHEEIAEEQAKAIIKDADLHTGPYGAMGGEIDQVLYAGETVAAIHYLDRWLEVPAHQSSHISAELSMHGYDPLPF